MPLACSVGCAAGCAAACSPGRSAIRDWPLELQPKRPSKQRKQNDRDDAERVFRTTVLQSIQCSIRPWLYYSPDSIRAEAQCHVAAPVSEYSTYVCNTRNSKLAYPSARKAVSSWSPGKTKTAGRRSQAKLYSPRTEFRQTKSSKCTDHPPDDLAECRRDESKIRENKSNKTLLHKRSRLHPLSNPMLLAPSSVRHHTGARHDYLIPFGL
jgi:hypothetical protein